MLAEAALYLDEPEFRRAQLVASLVNPANTYSRQRLGSYGLRTKGWDLLPAWNPRSIPATTDTARAIRAGTPVRVDPDAAPIWDGQRPRTMKEWTALGREVFFRYPLRVEVFMDWALANPDVGERVGVRPDGEGMYAGVVQFQTVDGKSALGITCAICHTSLENGRFVAGAARRAFDYGALRLAFHEDTKAPVSADLARRMKTWGPGRADVTEDDDEDPVAIPDLWGLRHQTFLTQAGTIAHVGPTALAIRQETQLLHSNHQKVRPPREVAYALAMYLYTLEPPVRPAPPKDDPVLARGRELFSSRCRGCTYRPPALLRVGEAGPYFHHGAVPTLEDVFSPARLEGSYASSPLRKGPVPGHTYGLDWPKADRAAVVSYLRSL